MSSPDLTPDEIKKIKDNLIVIKNFNLQLNQQLSEIILAIWSILQGQIHIATPPDPSLSKWASIIVATVAIIGIVTEHPVIDMLAVILAGVFEYMGSDSADVEDRTGYDLAKSVGYLTDRNEKTFLASQIIIAQMIEDPNTYRDQVFDLKEYGLKSGTIRDLINVTIIEDSSFDLAIQCACRQFRSETTVLLMEPMKNWEMCFVQDLCYKGSDFGVCFRPYDCPGHRDRIRYFNTNDLGNNVRIMATDEIRHFHPDYTQVNACGNSDTDFAFSFLHAANSFVTQFPSAFVGAYAITNKRVVYNRWYILEGKGKIPMGGSENYALANGEFLNWLFIDDGVGNVINKDGIIYRYDFVKHTSITDYGYFVQQPNSVVLEDGEHVVSTWLDYRYPGKNTNSKVKFYSEKLTKLAKKQLNKTLEI
jgi:hypothetical protein